MKKLTILFSVATLIVSLSVTTVWAEKQTYTFGVHPFKEQTTLVQMFTPLMKFLEKELGAKIQFRRARSYEDAMDALISGEVDISYMGPSGFALLDMKSPGQIRICAAVENEGKATFKGVIATKRGSGVETLSDLSGKSFAFGDRKSTLSFYMPAYMLMQAGVFNSINYDFYGNHDKVAANVLRSKTAAGGLKPAVAEKYQDKGLVVIAESEPVYEHMIVVSSKVDQATYEKISKALIELEDPSVYTAIKRSLTGFAKVEASDYDNLKKVIQTVDAKVPM